MIMIVCESHSYPHERDTLVPKHLSDLNGLTNARPNLDIAVEITHDTKDIETKKTSVVPAKAFNSTIKKRKHKRATSIGKQAKTVCHCFFFFLTF